MRKLAIAIALVLLVESALALSLRSHQDVASFCYKDSYERGAGVIPTGCPDGKENVGLLCYDKCQAGYSRVGVDCASNCPTGNGWSDDGLTCKVSEYGRGVGYLWQFGDGFDSNGQFNRCEAAAGKGNCEQTGPTVYPKCQQGFTVSGCCSCKPNAPNCNSLGLDSGSATSCSKKIIKGVPQNMDCPSGMQYNAGLCYPACKADYYGAGPTCWSNPPAGWVNCGIGAAKDEKTCNDTVETQTKSSVSLVVESAAFGLGKLADISKDPAKVSEVKNELEDLKKLADGNQDVQSFIKKQEDKFQVPDAENQAIGLLKDASK